MELVVAGGEERLSTERARIADCAKIAVALFARFRVLLSPPMTTPASLRRIEASYTGLLKLLYYNTSALLRSQVSSEMLIAALASGWPFLGRPSTLHHDRTVRSQKNAKPRKRAGRTLAGMVDLQDLPFPSMMRVSS